MLEDHISRNARWERFTDKLTGKELTYEPTQDEVKYLEGSVRLQPNEIDVEGEVMWSHETLEFYVPVRFDADKVFGSEIATAPRDSYVNVYAYYNLEQQAVCDDLTVLLKTSDMKYRNMQISTDFKLTVGSRRP